MGWYALWAGVPYALVRLMGRYFLWAGTSYGTVRLMGRYVLCVGTSYGPGNTVIGMETFVFFKLVSQYLRVLTVSDKIIVLYNTVIHLYM
jgi:hypothetical protein